VELGGPAAKRGIWVLLSKKKVKQIQDIHKEGAHINTSVKTDLENNKGAHINTNS
jgi:hypothetical protein